jgi:hypothetical protein
MDGNNHTITVRGNNDIGASVILYTGTPLGGRFTDGGGDAVPIGGDYSGVVDSPPVVIGSGGIDLSGLTIPVGSLYQNAMSVSSPTADNSAILWLAGGAAVVVGGLLFAKYMTGKEEVDELNYYSQ